MPPTELPTDTTPTVLSQGEAARACNVAASTIRRARRTGRLPGATSDGAKGWKIPVSDLADAGLLDRVTPSNPATETTPTPTAEVAELREKLAAAELRAAVAEAVADGRERVITTQAQALRMLEPAQTAGPASSTTAQEADQARPRRRWWTRAGK